jgi:hypothetical protein
MDPCTQCGNHVSGFLPQPTELGRPTKPDDLPTWLVMGFPCEHLIRLPYSTATPASAPVGKRAVRTTFANESPTQ